MVTMTMDAPDTYCDRVYDLEDPFDGWLSFGGRLPRQGYAFQFLPGIVLFLVTLSAILLGFALMLGLEHLGWFPETVTIAIAITPFAMAFGLSTWHWLSLSVRRAHDIGWSAKWAILSVAFGYGAIGLFFWFSLTGNIAGSMISFFGVGAVAMPFGAALMGTQGTQGPNRFGPDPLEDNGAR